jgi:hypothetical protein
VETKHNAITIINRNRHLLLACCILLSSCTEADLERPGFVQILPDRARYDVPKVEYRFYNDKTCLVRESDEEGNFKGQLRPGAYQVLATNTDATGATFSEMDNYDEATVTIDDAAQATRSTLISSELSSVYSVVIGKLVVPNNGTALVEPTPVLLTKQLVLVFTLLDGLDKEIAAIAGEVYGVYPSVYLATGLPSERSVEQSPSTGIPFSVAGEGVKRKAQVSMLGLRDPGKEPTYTNNLLLTLRLSDGREEKTTINLTTILSDIIEDNKGSLPVRLSFFIDLKRWVGGIEGSFRAWSDGSVEIIKVE